MRVGVESGLGKRLDLREKCHLICIPMAFPLPSLLVDQKLPNGEEKVLISHPVLKRKRRRQERL